MGSGQSVLRHSPLACIKRNLKPLLLTDLKVHKLESLCSQIWPQYKQITKTSGLSSGLLISIFYQISLTSSNGMANGQRSHIFKPSGTLEAILLSARTVLPIKSCSALSPPPLQKNPNLKPPKGPLNHQLPILTWQMSLLPTAQRESFQRRDPIL